MERIYLDYAATAPMRKEVLDAMLPYFTENFGNPSAIYRLGAEAKWVVEESRKRIAKTIGARPEEIFFTGSGTEADNWAITALVGRISPQKQHIVTTAIEHPAVLSSCKEMERQGYEVTYLKPDGEGLVSPKGLREALRPDTALVSVMMANNEIGTIEPVEEMAEICKERGILFHTDAVQTYGKLSIDVGESSVSMMSVGAHKIGGPKGVGFLYVNREVPLFPLIFGGAQEKRKRAGTENVPGIVGFAKAAEMAFADREAEENRLSVLRDYFIERVLREIPCVRLTGARTGRLGGHASFLFDYVEGETLLILLDVEGICASSGSACTVGQAAGSHVLRAIGIADEDGRGALRFTMGRDTTREMLDKTVECLKEIVERARKMSPYAHEFEKKMNR